MNNDKFKWGVNIYHALVSGASMYVFALFSGLDDKKTIAAVVCGVILGSSNEAITFIRNAKNFNNSKPDGE